MKSIFRISFLVFAVAVLLPSLSSLGEDKLFEGESLGALKLGLKQDAVVKALGKPESKGKEVLWEAIGEWVQDWDFPKEGLTLAMSSGKKGGAKSVLNITAAAPCKLVTSRGIGIGSSEADLVKAYRDLHNKEESESGKHFVAGSIYGGAMFTLKGGKVMQIFVGAAAE